MPTSQAIFGTWHRERIAPRLRDQGFAGSGQDFHRRVDGNWQAINVQRSKYSNADEVKFTINLGTASAAVIAAAREDPDEPQREVLCHWRTRIGSLLPGKHDVWWTIRSRMSARDLDRLGVEVGDALIRRGVPELDRMVADQAILELHSASEGSDMSPYALDIVGPLLREVGPPDRFAAYMTRLDASRPEPLLYRIHDIEPARMGPARTAKALEKLQRPGWGPRQQALFDLAHARPSPEIVAAVLQALQDPVGDVRMAAAHAAGHLRITESLAALNARIRTAPRHHACYAALAAVRLVDRLDAGGRESLSAAIRARHSDAVGHERPLLGQLLRELGAA
jgi:hypothetical protein